MVKRELESWARYISTWSVFLGWAYCLARFLSPEISWYMCGESSIEGSHSPFPTWYLKVAISYHAVRIRKKDGYGPSNEDHDKLNSPRKACHRRKRTQNASDFVILFLSLEFCCNPKEKQCHYQKKIVQALQEVVPSILLPSTEYCVF